jgi:hypothetical protein
MIADLPQDVVFHGSHLLSKERKLVVNVAMQIGLEIRDPGTHVADARVVEHRAREHRENRHYQRHHLGVCHFGPFVAAIYSILGEPPSYPTPHHCPKEIVFSSPKISRLPPLPQLNPTIAPDPELLLISIEAFLATCRRPAALEYGENPLPLLEGSYALEVRSGRLSIEIWDETRSVSRRILSVERPSTGVLDCAIQKFGGKPSRLTFLDLDRPQTVHRTRMGERQNFAEQFRRMLQRQFPGWEIETLSSALDLQHSFSSVFPRAKVVRGTHTLAAIACPDPADEPAFLTFSLIWHHHLKSRRRIPGHTSLCLFLPETAGNLTAHRLRWLTGESLTPRLFRFNPHGSAGEIDPQDLGNLQTRLASIYAPPHLSPEAEALLHELKSFDSVGCSPELHGAISIRHRGLEFARLENGHILLGIEVKEELRPSQFFKVTNFAAQLSNLSAAQQCAATSASDATPPQFSERWLESLVRNHLPSIEPGLLPQPIHSQVLTFAAGDRDLIDLLAVSQVGRLAILELKVAEDLHLPLQALDYWMRIAWHLQRDELRHLFPGSVLQSKPPRLLLIAPAMAFHSSNTDIFRYFSPEIEVERIGLNSDWRKSLRVVLRLIGADLPISHGSTSASGGGVL